MNRLLLFLSAGILSASPFQRGWSTDLIGGEGPRMLSPEDAQKAFTMAEGYEVNLWASEVSSSIQSPAAMTFDSSGRLWVANMPSQPHAKPSERPRDSIVVLEDTDRDGVADKSTVFYDDLYLPMGIAVADGGKTVYVCSEPNLLKLTDHDGDLKADEVEIMLHGFGTEDNHHFISGFQWGPGGRLFFGQGLFLNTQVETPFGPVRAYEGTVFRLDPRNHKLEDFGSYGWSNVWGIVFDHWGQGLVADASPALNYYLSHTTSRFDYPKPGKYTDFIDERGGYSFTPAGRRPSCGNELLLSEHFPEEVRGWYVTNQMKGWHGLRWYRLQEEGSGYVSDQPRGEEELLSTTDITFRPVAQQIGPDGALYVLDYYNPIVGHTTYSFRDPRRVQTHGRVWRITAKDRPLIWQPKVLGEPAEVLLNLLKNPNHRWRYFARRELQQRRPEEVVPVVEKWVAATKDEHDWVEALWIYQGLDHFHFGLLKRLLNAESHDARTAAVRVLRYWQESMKPDEALSLLEAGIADKSQRVRLEALVACGFHARPDKAIKVAARILDQEMDSGCELAARETLTWLAGHSASVPEDVDRFLLPYISDEELLSRELDLSIANEMLRRVSVPAERHFAALKLAGNPHGRSATEELVKRLEAPGEETKTRAVLTSLLLSADPESLREMADAIGSLVSSSADGEVRAYGEASLLRLGIAPGLDTSAPDARKIDLLKAIKLAGRGKSPESIGSLVPNLLDQGESRSVRLAAIDALSQFPQADRDSLNRLAAIADQYAESDLPLSFAALESMKRIPESVWPSEFSGKTLTRIQISATADIKYDITEFSVPAGGAVELTFFNPDNIYHNLVIVKPDAAERIGTAADAMAAQPDGLEKHYVPDDPGVLYWTKQLTLGVARSETLRFFAPTEAGDYPYLCTFPGHWRVMRGVMHVK